MRTIWLALVPVVLGVGSTAHAQQAPPRKAKPRNDAVWAASYQEANAPQPLAPPVSNAAPAPGQPAPVMGHPMPIPAPPEHGACCPDKCGKGCKLCEMGRGLLDWLCYRRSRSCAKEYCGCYYCHPPVYAYFLDHCREGANWSAAPGCCGCGGPCCWGKLFATGHAMFAMPTGQGCCGVR